jgi:hypothetical protein
MRLEPFKAAHFDLMDLQAHQHEAWARYGNAAYLLEVERHGGWSVFHGEQLLLCGGVIARIPEEPLLWSFISAHAGPYMLHLLRITRRYLEVCGHSFVYGTSEVDWPRGCRFLELLGFERMRWDDGTPAIVPAYGLDGKDHALYEWVS